MYRKEQSLQASIATSAVLSYLGWLGAQTGSTAPASTAVSVPAMGRKRRVKGASASSSSGTGSQPVNRADLAVRPPTMLNVPSRIPKSITNQVVWDVVKIDSEYTATVSGAPTETVFTASLALHPQATSWRALFDQWTVPQFTVTFESEMPPGSVSLPNKLYTALDFDNATAIGSISAIEDFSTCQVEVMQPQNKKTRSVKPTLNQSSVIQRSWVDSGSPSTVFYGIRMILGQNAALRVACTQTIYFAFRNQI